MRATLAPGGGEGKIGVDRVFLDDDFRIADSPGTIGGCFCNQQLEEFR
jgi:hypothetical protein